MQIAEIKEPQIPLLLAPYYASHRDAHELKRDGLIRYDEDKEEYRHTEDGEALVNNLRQAYGMTWDGQVSGGGRWVVAGRELHCGDALQIMLADGSWKFVRFEVAFSGDAKAQATGRRIPKLYVALAGDASLVCDFEPEHCLFRWSGSKS